MANEEHLAILKQGVKTWNNWRSKNPDILPNLKEADMSDMLLDGVLFQKANLEAANFTGASLIQAQFTDAIVNRANFDEANLERVYLQAAYVAGATLINANLTGARLGDSNFAAANFAGANFTTAILNAVDFNGANLTGSDFTEARCHETVFADVDLSETLNLNKVRHEGPSTIGIDTLYRSRGKIPEIFLRGCGVSDRIIAFARSLVATPIDFYSCFISYSTADEDFAKLLFDKLQGAGIRCWFAPEQILPGERIDEAIDRGIRYWDKVLFCASKSSLTEKWWVDFEVDKAFKKARDLQRQRGERVGVIIPLNLDGYLFGPEYENNPKRSIFEMTLAPDFVGWRNDLDKFNREVENVIKALRTDGGKEAPPVQKL